MQRPSNKYMPMPQRPSPKIAIIIVNWNGLRDTLACLKSLKHLSYPNYEIIIVDNGSTDPSASVIKERFPEHLLVETGVNLGFTGGNNVGMQLAMERGAEYLFLLNNDTAVASDVLEHFLELFQSRPKAGILGAKLLLFDKKNTLDHLGGIWNRKKAIFELIGAREEDGPKWGQPQEIDYVCGAGLIIKRSVIEKIGYLEPAFFLIWEESDFCFRAKKAGFQILTCPQAKVWHKVSASFTGGKPHSTYFWWRNRLLWIERNCSNQEKWSIYLRILIPDILHMLKIYGIKKTQLFFEKKYKAPVHIKEKQLKLLKNRAALWGIRDYFLRRFGKGPNWILFDEASRK